MSVEPYLFSFVTFIFYFFVFVSVFFCLPFFVSIIMELFDSGGALVYVYSNQGKKNYYYACKDKL